MMDILAAIPEPDENAKPIKGLVCRRCGCRHFHVRNTIRGDNRIIRWRICRYCGTAKKTVESGR